MKKNLKRLFLLLGSLLAVASLSGCFLMKGSRANIEKQFEVLGEIYPTQNVNDLREKFPEGFRLVHIRNIDDMTYSVILENDTPSQEITGQFMVEQDNNETRIPDILLEANIEVDSDGNLHSKQLIPEDYQVIFDNFTFLFEDLDLSKEEFSKFEYQTHSSNANDDYFISYHIEHSELTKLFKSKESDLRLTLGSNFGYDKDYGKNVRLRVGTDSIEESIRSNGQIKEIKFEKDK